MKHFAQYLCKACKVPLTWNEVMYSHGVCPHCGKVTRGTIVEYDLTSVPVVGFWNQLKAWWRNL